VLQARWPCHPGSDMTFLPEFAAYPDQEGGL
jgi:hypothetical protein